MAGDLLTVENLTVRFGTKDPLAAVNGVSYTIGPGERVALVGESGSGKSVSSLGVMRLLPPQGAAITADRLIFDGKDILATPEKQMGRVRGKGIGMIFQDPSTALNPVYTVGEQVAEGIRYHDKLSRADAKAAALDMLKKVGIQDAETRYNAYPHELSGGMRQRVMIAGALILKPKLLIADEPTTALDVTIQKQILDLLVELQEETGMSVLLITHDLGVVRQFAQRVLVMYAGQIVEECATEALFHAQYHPYTHGLFQCIPRLNKKEDRLYAIPGAPPQLKAIPEGCRFAPRCPHVMDACKVPPGPPLREAEDRRYRCLLDGAR